MAVYAITLAFAPSQIIRPSLRAFYATRNPNLKLAGHFVIDQHYPLRYQEVRQTLESESKALGFQILDPGKNLGLHEGFNWALRQIGPKPDDIIIGYDGDSVPLIHGWDMALVRAIEGYRSDGFGPCVWSTLGNPRTLADVYARGFDPVTVDGYLRLFLTRQAVTNSVCAWRYSWLHQHGLLQEPRAFYGHLEGELFKRLQHGLVRWGILPDWTESDELRKLHDREYIVYKWRHSHLNDWPGDFASYCEAGCPGSEVPCPEQIP